MLRKQTHVGMFDWAETILKKALHVQYIKY